MQPYLPFPTRPAHHLPLQTWVSARASSDSFSWFCVWTARNWFSPPAIVPLDPVLSATLCVALTFICGGAAFLYHLPVTLIDWLASPSSRCTHHAFTHTFLDFHFTFLRSTTVRGPSYSQLVRCGFSPHRLAHAQLCSLLLPIYHTPPTIRSIVVVTGDALTFVLLRTFFPNVLRCDVITCCVTFSVLPTGLGSVHRAGHAYYLPTYPPLRTRSPLLRFMDGYRLLLLILPQLLPVIFYSSLLRATTCAVHPLWRARVSPAAAPFFPTGVRREGFPASFLVPSTCAQFCRSPTASFLLRRP